MRPLSTDASSQAQGPITPASERFRGRIGYRRGGGLPLGGRGRSTIHPHWHRLPPEFGHPRSRYEPRDLQAIHWPRHGAVATTPEQFSTFVKQEVARWHPLIKELNIRLD